MEKANSQHNFTRPTLQDLRENSIKTHKEGPRQEFSKSTFHIFCQDNKIKFIKLYPYMTDIERNMKMWEEFEKRQGLHKQGIKTAVKYIESNN